MRRRNGFEKDLLLNAVQLWLFNDKNELLIQRRSKSKEVDSGKIDVSTSGHVKQGETPDEAIYREAFEEIGLTKGELVNCRLKPIGQIHVDFRKIGKKGNYLINEYVAITKKEAEDFKLQKDEVDDVAYIDFEIFKRAIKYGTPSIRIPNVEPIWEVIENIDNYLREINNEKDSDCR